MINYKITFNDHNTNSFKAESIQTALNFATNMYKQERIRSVKVENVRLNLVIIDLHKDR